MKRRFLIVSMVICCSSISHAEYDYQTIISYLYPTAINRENYELRDDGKGTYISAWKVPSIARPSLSYLQSKAAEAESNKNSKKNQSDAEEQALLDKLKLSQADIAVLKRVLSK